jgi:hypothetical protein
LASAVADEVSSSSGLTQNDTDALARSTVYENGATLPTPSVTNVLVQLPLDKSFASNEEALAHVQGPPLANDLDLYWNQQLLDVLLEYPIRSDRPNFAIHPSVDRLALVFFMVTVVAHLAWP